MKIIIKPMVIKIILVIIALSLILLATFIAMDTAKSRRAAETSRRQTEEILNQYEKNVAQKTDAYALTKNGLRQLNINLPALALISLKRAADIKQNYRDAHLALGLAQLKTGDVSGALASFQTAERLDPIYAKTYELLKIVYEKLEDAASAQKAEEKWKFLVKK